MKKKDVSLAIAGAGVGAALGYVVFQHFLSRGLILFVAPGALLGVGRALFSRIPSNLLGLICAAAGLGLSLPGSPIPYTSTAWKRSTWEIGSRSLLAADSRFGSEGAADQEDMRHPKRKNNPPTQA
jgi:hypothetical protein